MQRFCTLSFAFGLILMIFGLTYSLPIAASLVFDDGMTEHFLRGMSLNIGIGGIMAGATMQFRGEIKNRDGYLLVALFWLLMASAATLLLLWGMPGLSFTDAFFEAMSGFTTTSATVLVGLDTLAPSLNLWRHELNWIGGLGIIVLAVAILPLLGVGKMQLYKAEIPGSVKDSKLTPRIAETARLPWLVYAGFTKSLVGSNRCRYLADTVRPAPAYAPRRRALKAASTILTWMPESKKFSPCLRKRPVYPPQYQLIPYQPVQEQFEHKLIVKLLASHVLHADETGINIDGKTHWLHRISSPLATLYYTHDKRGMKVPSRFTGMLVHVHWKSNFRLLCLQAPCNAHHLRELAHAHEQEHQARARRMMTLLQLMAHAVNAHQAGLPESVAIFKTQYRAVFNAAEIECPPPDPQKTAGQRGRPKRGKSRKLLERLINHETETQRFLIDPDVPFSPNNRGENDIRMIKLHQKISGCVRSLEGVETFCRVRSYLPTCRKNNVSATQALDLLAGGKLPDFIA